MNYIELVQQTMTVTGLAAILIGSCRLKKYLKALAGKKRLTGIRAKRGDPAAAPTDSAYHG